MMISSRRENMVCGFLGKDTEELRILEEKGYLGFSSFDHYSKFSGGSEVGNYREPIGMNRDLQ